MRSLLRVNKQCCSVLLINRSPVKGAVSGPEESNVSCLWDRSSRNVRKQADGATPCGQVVDPRAPLSCGSLKKRPTSLTLSSQKAENACANTECTSSDTLRVRDKISGRSPKGISPFFFPTEVTSCLGAGWVHLVKTLWGVWGGKAPFWVFRDPKQAWLRV